jgi:hypothetical protein
VYYCVAHSSALKVVKRTVAKNIFDPTVVSLRSPSDEVILQPGSLPEKNSIEDVAKRSARRRATDSNFPLAQKCRDLLRNAGFVRPDATVKHDTLISEWLAYFGPEYCYLTNMNARKIRNWLVNISVCASASDFPHPFMFIAAESLLEHHSALLGSFVPATRCGSKNLETPTSSSEWEVVAPNFEPTVCVGAAWSPSAGIKHQSPARPLATRLGGVAPLASLSS